MLGYRLEGDPDEAADFLQKLRTAGVEVLQSTVRHRGDGIAHVYGTLRMPDDATPEAPLRATVVDGQPAVRQGRSGTGGVQRRRPRR